MAPARRPRPRAPAAAATSGLPLAGAPAGTRRGARHLGGAPRRPLPPRPRAPAGPGERAPVLGTPGSPEEPQGPGTPLLRGLLAGSWADPMGEPGGGAGTCSATGARARPGTHRGPKEPHLPGTPLPPSGSVLGSWADPRKGQCKWRGHPPASSCSPHASLPSLNPGSVVDGGNLLKGTLMGQKHGRVPEIPGFGVFVNCLFLTSQHRKGSAVGDQSSQRCVSPLQ